MFAVRAGPPLLKNIKRALRGESLVRYTPQVEKGGREGGRGEGGRREKGGREGGRGEGGKGR